MTEREAFVAAIKKDPYDQTTRLVFADWLEEHGEDDESLFQRNWTPEYQRSENYLRGYAARINYKEAYGPYLRDDDEISEAEKKAGDDYHTVVTYEQLLEGAAEYLEGAESSIYLNFDTPDFIYEERTEFWKHFMIVTGREVEIGQQGMFFRCAC